MREENAVTAGADVDVGEGKWVILASDAHASVQFLLAKKHDESSVCIHDD